MLLTKQVVGVEEEQALDLLSLRMRFSEEVCSSELPELDEAMDILEQDDRTEAKKQKEDMERRQSRTRDFEGAWKVRKHTIEAAKAKAQAKSCGKARKVGRGGKGGRHAADPMVQPRALPPGVLEQSQLEPLAPPGGYIWHANNGQSWQAHLPPWPRVSFSWSAWTPRGAAMECLRYLWSKWAIHNGRDTNACPIKGLFSERGADAALPGGGVARLHPRPQCEAMGKFGIPESLRSTEL